MQDSNIGRALGIGLAAGLAGTGLMFALRTFDQKYAPRTIAKTRQDPGEFMVSAAERLTGLGDAVPEQAEKAAAMATHFAYGSSFGVLYGLLTAGRKNRSPLLEGATLGAIVYAVGHLGWLPAIGLSKPAWKEKVPEVGGELARHVAYGIATAATFKAIESVSRA